MSRTQKNDHDKRYRNGEFDGRHRSLSGSPADQVPFTLEPLDLARFLYDEKNLSRQELFRYFAVTICGASAETS